MTVRLSFPTKPANRLRIGKVILYHAQEAPQSLLAKKHSALRSDSNRQSPVAPIFIEIMVPRFKKSIQQAIIMLNIITQNDENLGALFDFQLFLLKKIKECEQAITKAKEKIKQIRLEKANGRPSKARSLQLRALLPKAEEKLEKYQYMIYIWKCFGDGIAFHYCDKYALKHMLYDSDYRVKETSGFISGKSGLKNELKFLRYINLKKNIPAILCDLTNNLRHGDVCLLGSSDPWPIEIKTASKLDKRGEKQVANIKEIVDFFESDSAENFRNAGRVIRREHVGNEINHIDAINKCIARSYIEQTSFLSPEEGITYVAVTGEFKNDVFDRAASKYLHIIHLNEYKTRMAWQPYYPFTLSIAPEHLFNFINGDTSIFVLLDAQAIKKRFRQSGLILKYLQDPNWYAQISKTEGLTEGAFRISEQSFMRLAFDFQSLGWMLKQREMDFYGEHLEDIGKGEQIEVPADWFNIDDGIPVE